MMLRFLQRKEETIITPESIKPMEVNPPICPKGFGNVHMAGMVGTCQAIIERFVHRSKRDRVCRQKAVWLQNAQGCILQFQL